MQQIALIPSGCNPYVKCGPVATANYLIFPSTLAIYVHSATASRHLVRVLTGPTCPMTSFGANDDIVVAVTPNDSQLYLWGLASGDRYTNLATKFFDGDCAPVSVAASASGKGKIVIGCNNGKIIVWHYEQGKSYMLSAPGDSVVEAIRFSPALPHIFAVGTSSGHVGIFDVDSPRLIYKLEAFDYCRQGEGLFDKLFGDSPRVVDLAFDPLSPTYLLVGSATGYLALIDNDKQQVVHTFDRCPSGFASMCWIPTQPGSFLTTDGKTNTLRYWNVSSKSSLTSYRADQTPLLYVTTIPPQHDSCFIGLKDGAVACFNLAQKKQDMRTLPGHGETVFDCRFSTHDKDTFSSASYDGTIKIWNIRSMTLQATIEVKKVVYCASWSPEGKQIAAGLATGEVGMYDVATQRELWKVKPHNDVTWRVTWSLLEPGLIASASREGVVCVIAAQNGQILRTYRHPRHVYGVEFDPFNSRQLATGCHDGIVRFFDMQDDRLDAVFTATGHTKEVFQVCFNPTIKNIILSSSNDFNVRCWDISKRDANNAVSCKVLAGHTDKVRALAWSHIAPYIAVSGSWDCSVRLWDTRSGVEIGCVRNHTADVYAISSHPDRPLIFVSGSRDTTIRFWTMTALSHFHLDAAIGMLQTSFEPNLENVNASTVVQRPCAGPSVQRFLQRLAQAATPVDRLDVVSTYFDFPHGAKDVVACTRYVLDNRAPFDQNCEVPPIDILASLADERAQRHAAVKGKLASAAGTSQRESKLIAAAEQFLRVGKVKEYCELMIDAGETDRGISAAPMVSHDFWRSICSRAADTLAAQGDPRAIDLFICSGDGHKAADFLAARGEFTEAMIIVQTCPQRSLQSVASTATSLPTPQPPQVDARVSQDKLSTFARARASKYINNAGNPNLAAAALLSAGVKDEAVIQLIRGCSVPLAHLLIHALPVSQETIDSAFSASMIQAAQLGMPNSAGICATRQSKRLRASATGLALISTLPSTATTREASISQFMVTVAPSTQGYAPQSDLDAFANGVLQRQDILAAATAFLERLYNEERVKPPSTTKDQLLLARELSGMVIIPAGAEVQPLPRRFFFIVYSIGVLLAERCYTLPHLVPMMLTCVLHFCDDPTTSTELRQRIGVAETAVNRSQTPLPTGRSPLTADLQPLQQPTAPLKFTPLGARLPCCGRDGRQITSFVTNKVVQGPFLVLENGTSVVSQEEALEWHACCWYSPLATGERIVPL